MALWYPDQLAEPHRLCSPCHPLAGPCPSPAWSPHLRVHQTISPQWRGDDLEVLLYVKLIPIWLVWLLGRLFIASPAATFKKPKHSTLQFWMYGAFHKRKSAFVLWFALQMHALHRPTHTIQSVGYNGRCCVIVNMVWKQRGISMLFLNRKCTGWVKSTHSAQNDVTRIQHREQEEAHWQGAC